MFYIPKKLFHGKIANTKEFYECTFVCKTFVCNHKKRWKIQVVLDCKKTNAILEVIGVAFISEEVKLKKLARK